jgi:hypothetical protein
MYCFLLIYIFTNFVLFTNGCKNICEKKILNESINIIMTKLENDITKQIEIMNIEIKMELLYKTIYLSKHIDKEFEELNQHHKNRILYYEKSLESIGLSPARENEIYLIEEMEIISKKKRKNILL